MGWPSTVATGCLGLGVSAFWARDVAAKKADIQNRRVTLKWHIIGAVYLNTDWQTHHSGCRPRLVPMPSTVSPEAQQWLKDIERESPQPKDLGELRARTDAWQKSQSAEAK